MLKGLALIGTGIWLLFVVSKAYAGRQRLQNSGFTRRYPHVDTLFGIDLLLQVWRDFHRGQLAEGMRRRHERYGETFITTELGSPCVYTIDPENIRTITTSQFEDFGKSSWVGEASKHVGAGILLNQGEAWKQSKTLLKPIFAHSTFGDPVLVEPHFQQLAATIRSHGGRQVDFQDLAAGFMLDTVSDFLFGSSTGCLDAGVDSSEAEHFLACIKAFEPPSGMFMAVGALAWIELLPSYRRLIRVVNGMKSFFANRLDAIISSDGTGCVQSSSGTSCFRMMKTIGVPVAQIQAELKNIYFASFDTSTALLSNVVEILASRPAIQQRLRDEIAHLGDQAPGRNDLAKVRYLRYVILEALRLYSPVTSHSRRALVDTTLPRGGGSDGLGPVTIAKGTTIIWSTYALNRSPKHYGTDWAEFRPDRWEELEGRCSHFFMPFGSGPRICMGQQMAQAQLAYVIVRLLQNFSAIESSDSRPFREAAAVSFYNGNGTLVSLRSQWR